MKSPGWTHPRAFLFTVDRVGSLQNERAITPQEPPKPASAYRSCRGISSNQQIYARRGLGALPQISQPKSPVPNEVTGEGYELDRYTGYRDVPAKTPEFIPGMKPVLNLNMVQ